MKTIATANLVVFIIAMSIAMYIGLDPKKWRSWVLALYGFLTFYLVAIVGTGDFYKSVTASAIATIATMFSGITTFWTRERAKRWLKEHHQDET